MLILYLTHRSWTDAFLMMTSVLGALAGGAIFQWLLGFRFSVAVQVGYIACFGMAVETGVVMLVYLRAVFRRPGAAALREPLRRGRGTHPPRRPRGDLVSPAEALRIATKTTSRFRPE